MASDVFVDDFTNDKQDDLNGDIFMSSGIMSPKELYLTDLPQCKDAFTDHAQYKGAASSDSGISTLDDFQDVANVTDLNSILDTDFTEFDLSWDFVVPKPEQDDSFDPGVIVKSEPGSPFSYNSLQVTPDLFFPGEITIKEEGSPLTLPAYHQCDSLSPASSVYSPQQNYTIEPFYEPSSPSQLRSPSPQLSLNSQPLQIGHACSNYPAAFPYIHQHRSQLQHLGSLPDTPSSTYSADSPHHASPSPPSTPNFIVVPCVKKETQVSILSSPGGMLVQGDLKPIFPATFNIDAILNSKVKIQPKPGSELGKSKGGSHWVTTTTSSHLPFSSHQSFPIITSSTISTSGTACVADEKTIKRAQRIIKNRESASLSRKRKKEYLTSLEDRLQQCRDDNERLLRENDTLRQQVEFLQRENSGLKHLNLSPAKKICLMCLAFLLALNLSPFSFLNGPSGAISHPGIDHSYHPSGRHLMSLPEDSVDTLSEYESSIQISKDMWSTKVLMQFNEELSMLAEKLNITEKLGNMCPMYFNSTESNRLAEQLRGWMISQEEEKKKKEKKQYRKKKSYPPIKRFSTETFNAHPQPLANNELHGPALASNNYPIQVFSGGSYARQQLLSAIPRRNDTFYVLSFSTDYFLVPATAHNKTMRPRMSLLMPVVTPSINESTGHSQDSIGVMQIDCEILNTNLIHLYRSAFSEETLNNSTSYDSNESSHNRTGSGTSSMDPNRGRNDSNAKKSDQNIKYWKKLRDTTSG